MYTYIKSIVMKRGIGAQWTIAQLEDRILVDIYREFSYIVHVVNDDSTDSELYINFTATQPLYGDSIELLTEWLENVDPSILVFLDEPPDSKVKYIKYSNAIQVGYVPRLAKIGEHYPENFPLSELNDVGLERPRTSTDVSLIHKKALITVCGFLHLTDTDGKFLYIKDGGRTTKLSNENHIGIISFEDIGDLTIIPIKEEMIMSEVVGRPLYERADIMLDRPIDDKVVMLSIGGYLYLPEENVCWTPEPNIVSISLEKTLYLHRIYESRNSIDLSSLQLTQDEDNPNLILFDEVTSDDVITRYMTLSQSFIIVLDAKSIFHRKLYLEHMSLPGTFTSRQEPTYPLIVGYGRMAEYWKKREDRYWSVRINHSNLNTYLFDYRNMEELEYINDHRYPNRTYKRTRGFLLEIGSY